jgi:hypothetical protein
MNKNAQVELHVEAEVENYNCEYCSLEKFKTKDIKNHQKCIEIYEKHKNQIYEEFDKPLKIFILDRGYQISSISYCTKFCDIVMIIVLSLTEVYKTFACVFLVIFAPKECANSDDCSYKALYLNKLYNTVSLSIGCVAFSLFVLLYINNAIRESFLKKNFIYNPRDTTGVPGIHLLQKKGTDYLQREVPERPITGIFSILNVFNKLMKDVNEVEEYVINKNEVLNEIKKKLLYYNRSTKKITDILIFVYLLNVIFAIIAVNYYNNNQSAYIVVFTNIILICPKLYNSYMITQDGYYNTNSSYLVIPKEYNDYNEENKDKIKKILIWKRVLYFKNEGERKSKQRLNIIDTYKNSLINQHEIGKEIAASYPRNPFSLFNL